MACILLMRNLATFALILLSFPSRLDCLGADEDPYKILGVSRSASHADIKKAYKQMARNWHPDKNSDPEAQENFIKINEAHEILSDDEKKKNFDMYGTTGQTNNDGRHERTFYDPHSGFSFSFNGMPFQNTWSKPGQINRRTYDETVLPESYEKPYLIEIISHWCFACAQIEEVWEQATSSMKKLGVGIGIINSNRSPRLVNALGAGRVPTIIGVINGRVMFYNDRVTVQGLKDFVMGLFPRGLIEKITTKSVDTFLTTSVNNKPSVMLFSPKPLPSLLYHLVAFSSYKHQSFGFVSLTDGSGESLRKRFKVDSKEPTVLIFKDDVAVPDVVVRASELTSGKLREVVQAHRYLHFPRLSSRALFDELCPKESIRSLRRLCVILFTKQGQHEKEKLVLKLLAKDNKYLSEKRVKFLYVYVDVQRELIAEFKAGRKDDKCADNSTASKVIVLWNKGQKQVRYDWLSGGLCVSGEQESLSKARLTVMLDDLLSGQGKLRYSSSVPLIYNEHAPGLISALFNWCVDAFYYVKSSMYRRETLSLLSLLCGLGVILFFSVLLPGANDSIQRVHKASSRGDHREPQSVSGLLRLDPSTEQALIENAPPGHITFTLLVDVLSAQEAKKSPLIRAFADVVYPYTGNPNFKFAWLSISDNLAWCTEVMEVDRFGEVTPGIVLAINGHKKYLSIFKPTDLTKTAFFRSQGGDLMGFDGSDSEADTNEDVDGQAEYERKRQKVLSFSIQKELGNWLEKFCDGLVERKKVSEWPRFTD